MCLLLKLITLEISKKVTYTSGSKVPSAEVAGNGRHHKHLFTIYRQLNMFRLNYEGVCRLDDVLFICWKKGVERSYLQRMIQIPLVEVSNSTQLHTWGKIRKKVRTAAKKTWVVSCRGCVPTCWQFTIALSGVWKKFLSQHLLSKLWWRARLEAALMTWRRLGDLEETWRLPPFQERNARPAAAAPRAAAAALCFKGNHKSSHCQWGQRI